MTMHIQAKLDGGDWQLPLNRQETEAVLENIAAVVKLCEALGIEAVLIGPRFVIRISDIEVGRWNHALSGVIWAALDPVGRWGSCQCERWREKRSCLHIDALLRRVEPESGRLADVLPFPSQS
jgi:hypothetical protein